MTHMDLLERVKDADMVLVGIGEEFNGIKYCKEVPAYTDNAEALAKQIPWIQPLYRDYILDEKREVIRAALLKLETILRDKNYFVISTSTNAVVSEIPWKHGYLTMPCGSMTHKQCSNGCQEVLDKVSSEALLQLSELFTGSSQVKESACIQILGTCPKCGAEMVLNNYYHDKYNEAAYLDKWQLYTKWLQGTLNKKLLILELGSEFECPSVMRWPFEKITFYNQKAEMIRVNERLYQLTEELKGKGQGIPKNAIEWLQGL